VRKPAHTGACGAAARVSAASTVARPRATRWRRGQGAAARAQGLRHLRDGCRAAATRGACARRAEAARAPPPRRRRHARARGTARTRAASPAARAAQRTHLGCALPSLDAPLARWHAAGARLGVAIPAGRASRALTADMLVPAASVPVRPRCTDCTTSEVHGTHTTPACRDSRRMDSSAGFVNSRAGGACCSSARRTRCGPCAASPRSAGPSRRSSRSR